MFKPLLRTLPSLSGNFTLSCKLNEIQKSGNNDFYTYVRYGNLTPLQNSIFDKNIELNLLNGKYEYDVAKFYNIYSHMFYNDNFIYNKKNYKLLDLVSLWESNNDARNKDYEFGCKRIKYSQSGYQFSFYVPFYIDDINDIPEYFLLCLNFENQIEKRIKIYINKDNKYNYLGKYIKEYVKQIDDRCIFCMPESLQATYFGIDVSSGGLVQYKDNEFGTLYVNQTTINNFDNTICEGFSRNKLIMPQIIPLSFVFNINNLLTEYEKSFFEGWKINIYGYYCDSKGIDYKFYDFDINYTHAYNKYLKYNEYTGKYSYEYGQSDEDKNINVMNVGYPALNESKYTRYAYTNKITPKYCKFKMLLSPDYDPYITNLNYGYTYLQNPNQKYGYFPTMFKGIKPQAYLNGKDLRLPIGNDMETYYKTIKYYANNVFIDTTNIDKYIKLMTNYTSSWYTINHELKEDIFDDILWSDVKYNYSYHKGILYNLKDISSYNIDKFAVFLNPDLNYIDESKFANNIVRADYVLSKSDMSQYTINNYNDSYNMKNTIPIVGSTSSSLVCHSKIYDINSTSKKQSYVLIDKVMIQDDHGKYVEEQNYENENTYYKYDEILKLMSTYIDDSELLDQLEEFKISGFRKLDAVNNINYFETYKDAYGNELKRFMLTESLFRTVAYNSRYDWLKDSLYYIDSRSNEKRLVSSIYNLIDYNEDIYEKMVFFVSENYIHKNDIYNLIANSRQYSKLNTFLYQLNNLEKFKFERYKEENDILLKDFFVPIKKSYSNIYVDPYKLNSLITTYNKGKKSSDKLTTISKNSKTFDMYIKLINKDHIKEYGKNINADENGISLLERKSIFDNIFVKQRNWVIDKNYIDIKDTYITLDEFIMNYTVKYTNKYNDDLTYSDEYKNLLKVANEYNKAKNGSLTKSLEWIDSHISENRGSNGNFTLKLFDTNIYIDLCITKSLILLDDNIMQLIYKDGKLENYLYLYINDSCINDNYNIWPILSKNELKNITYKNIDDYLVPLFTSPYVNDYDEGILESMISKNKISKNKYIHNYGKLFKEIDILKEIKLLTDITYIDILNNIITENNLNELWYETMMISSNGNKLYENFAKDIINTATDEELKEYVNLKLDFIYNNAIDSFYEYVKRFNIVLYSLYDIMNIDYNIIKDNKIDTNNLIYDDRYNIYIYNHKGKNYAFYYININIDNTNNSFNILNDYNLNIHIESINGKSIKTYSQEYFDSIFPLLHPFIKKNIFNEFIRNNETIIISPYEDEILIKYTTMKSNELSEKQFRMLKDNDNDVLYDSIVKLNNEKKIKLLRYFNYITPYIKETNIIKDTWELKFMLHNNFEDIEKYSIFDKNDINIYKYNGINVYSGNYDKINLEFDEHEILSQYEYKHFNDNSLYNLPEEIIINEDKIYTAKEIEILKDKNILTERKKQILLRYFVKKKLDYKNIILFLYNKYDSSIFVEKKSLNTSKSEYIYKISYKFTLI